MSICDVRDGVSMATNCMRQQMETFKAVEKEMKTKAFSKEGLSAAAKLDPREKEKVEMCNFLGDMVDELSRQIESAEAEQDTVQATMKKRSLSASLSDINGT